MKQSYVLGSGLSGMVCGLILDWPVVGEEVGGQMAAPFPMGPRILKDCEESRYLLQKLDIAARPRPFKVGYYHKGQILAEADDEYRADYYYKTRGSRLFSKSSMNSGDNLLLGWDMEKIGLLNKLTNRVMVRVDRLDYLDIKARKFIGRSGDPVYYDKIISTLPLDSFLSLAGLPGTRTLASGTLFFNGVYSIDIEDYTFVYVNDPDIPFHRITKLDDNTCVYESITSKLLEVFDFIPKIHSYISLNRCQLLESLDVEEIGGVQLIGRYAQWSHKIKTEDVIRRARIYARTLGREA